MARIKYLPTTPAPTSSLASPAPPSSTASTPSALSAQERVCMVVDIGSNNMMAKIRRDGQWEDVYQRTGGAGADRFTRQNVIPTIVAVKGLRETDGHYILTGLEAARHTKHSMDYAVFRGLKLGAMEAAPSEQLRMALEREKTEARECGYTITDLLTIFLQRVVSQGVSNQNLGSLYFNCTDSWNDEQAQAMHIAFKRAMPDTLVFAIGECLSSIFGACNPRELSGGRYIAVDMGGSTMNLASGIIRNAVLEIRHVRTEPYGGDGPGLAAVESLYQKAVEDGHSDEAARRMCRIASNLCDEVLKSDPSAKLHDWLGPADLLDVLCTTFRTEHGALTQRRENALLDLIRVTCPDKEPATLILSGGGSMCPVWKERVRKIVEDHPHIDVMEDAGNNEVSSVLKGLKMIADDPTLLQPTHCPMDIWLRYDMDLDFEHLPSQEQRLTVALVCKRGQPLDPKDFPGERHPEWPLAYRLEVDEPGSLVFNSSVFTTPEGKVETDLGGGTDEFRFRWTYAEEVRSLGAAEQVLADQAHPGKQYHVYVFTVQSLEHIRLIIVHGDDFQEILNLSQTKHSEILRDGHLTQKSFGGSGIKATSFYQVARSTLENFGDLQGGNLLERESVPPKWKAGKSRKRLRTS